MKISLVFIVCNTVAVLVMMRPALAGDATSFIIACFNAWAIGINTSNLMRLYVERKFD